MTGARAAVERLWRVSLLVLLLAASPGRVQAGVNRWTSQGPEGGFVNAIAIDPTNPQTIFLAMNGGIWKSATGGQSWTIMNTGLTFPNAYSVAIDPSAHDVVYAGSDDGIYKSVDGGSHWNRAPNLNLIFSVSALAILPSAPNTVYAGCINGLFKSLDGGASWLQVSVVRGEVLSIIIDPNNPLNLWVGSYDSGLYRSTDGGANWISGGFSGSIPLYDIAIDPLTPTTIYVAAQLGVFRTVDGGSHWTNMGAGPPSPSLSAYDVVLDSANPSHLFVATNKGLFQSFDRAQSWVPVVGELPFHLVSVLSISPADATRLYAGTRAGGLFWSVDGGAHWSGANGGLAATTAAALVFSAANPQTAFLGMSDGGVWKSTDGGATWAPSSTGIGDRSVSAFAVDPLAPATIYAGLEGGIYRSTNGGASWASDGSVPGATPVRAIAIHPTMTEVRLAGIDDNGIYKTIDGGATWRQTLDVRGGVVTELVIDPHTPSRCYAGTSRGVYKSTDSGESWLRVTDFEYLYTVKIDPADPAILYAASYQRGVLKSIDTGANWVVIKEGDTRLNQYDLAIDPLKHSTLYVASAGDFFKSVDGGASWYAFGEGLSGGAFLSRVLIDRTGQRLYGTAYARGTFAYQIVFAVAGVSPPSGPAGSLVTMTGSGFETGAAAALGGVPMTEVVVQQSTQLTGRVPGLAEGVYDLVVTNPDGTQVTLTAAFLVDSTGRHTLPLRRRPSSAKSIPPRTGP